MNLRFDSSGRQIHSGFGCSRPALENPRDPASSKPILDLVKAPGSAGLRGRSLRQRVRDSLLGSRLAETGYFNRGYLEHLVAQHDSGARDYSAPIWTLLIFDAFLRNAVDARESAPLLRVAV